MRISFVAGLLVVLAIGGLKPSAAQDTPANPPKLAEDIHETIVRVPVTVMPANGKPLSGRIIVTHYRPDGPGPFPVVVINHGRSADRDKRATPARHRYTSLARYFIRRGFAVLVLTRLGYGDAGLDPDVEFSGSSCNGRDVNTGLIALEQQTKAAIDFARTEPWADVTRTVLVGQSYGGLGSIAMTGKSPAGVIAAINFAGGSGGSPERRPGRPCSPGEVTSFVKDAGTRARVPTLWLYAENDHYWGPDWPRRWHAAYTSAGGRAEMSMLPPVGDEGHHLISRGFTTWRPLVDRFLDKAGFPPPRSKDAPPSSGFAKIDDASRLPFVKEAVKTDAYRKFLNADIPRAFAVSPSGAWAWRSRMRDAPQQAIDNCEKFAKQPCKLYAVDDDVVWKE